eukprot:761247-Hanusia_phi.AAC.3
MLARGGKLARALASWAILLLSHLDTLPAVGASSMAFLHAHCGITRLHQSQCAVFLCEMRRVRRSRTWRRAEMCINIENIARKKFGSFCMADLFHDGRLTSKLVVSKTSQAVPHHDAVLRSFYDEVERMAARLDASEAPACFGYDALREFLSPNLLQVAGTGPEGRCMLCGRDLVHRFSSAAVETRFLEMFEGVMAVEHRRAELTCALRRSGMSAAKRGSPTQTFGVLVPSAGISKVRPETLPVPSGFLPGGKCRRLGMGWADLPQGSDVTDIDAGLALCGKQDGKLEHKMFVLDTSSGVPSNLFLQDINVYSHRFPPIFEDDLGLHLGDVFCFPQELLQHAIERPRTEQSRSRIVVALAAAEMRVYRAGRGQQG